MDSSQDQILTSPLDRQIFRLSLPTMMGFMFQALYDIVDMLWIGRISQSAVAAVTLFSTIFWVVEIFNEIIGNSSVALISQYHGAGDLKSTQLAAEQTLLFKFIMASIATVLLVIFLKPLIAFFTPDPEVQRLCYEYGIVRALFIPIFFSSYSVNTIFRCTGDAKTPMRLLLISAVANIIGDPLLMFDVIPGTAIKGMGLGMYGAAIATVGSIALSFIVGFILLLAGKAPIRIRPRMLFRLDWRIDRQLFMIGAPSGLNMLLRNIFGVAITKIIGIYGTGAIATLGVGLRIYNFSLMPQVGLGTGSGIIIGHCLGADLEDRAVKAVKRTTIYSFLLCSVFAVFLLVFPDLILKVFVSTTPDSQSMTLIRVLGFCLMASSLSCGLYSAFSGSGLLRPVLLSAVIAQYAVQLPFILLAFALKAPLNMIWLAFLLGDSAETISRYLFYRQGKWIKHRSFIQDKKSASEVQ